VQAKLDQQINNHKGTRGQSEALLTGRIFDDRGNRMSPSHARKGAIKHRYYLSSVLLNGIVASIARGRRWLNELITDVAASSETIAKREGCSTRKINMIISLAFLAPDLVRAAIDGRLPHGTGVTRLTDLPLEWSRQHEMLGLPVQ